MPNGDPRDRFFYPTLALMIDSYNIMNRCIDNQCKPVFGITKWPTLFSNTYIKCTLLIMLCLGSLGMDCVIVF